MSNYLDGLNPAQYDAVTQTEGPVLVVAGPGSGKTRVLTYRIAHLIEKGVAPWEVLSLTFTNKAAREMKERIEKVVGEKANQIWAGTFHSVFGKILRIEADKINYNSNFTIYDTDDSKSLINSIVKELSLDSSSYPANAVLSRISNAKSNIIPPAKYSNNPVLLKEDADQKRPHLYKIYEMYVSRCRKAGAMDFDDMLYLLYALFIKNEGVLAKYRNKFKYVLVDEFQDTNQLQYGIIKLLTLYENSPCNICVVGDDAQSIYAFRGATIDNILDYEKDFKNKGIKTIKLEQNYRSTHHIVQAANEVISYNSRQLKKSIWTDNNEGTKIRLIRTMTDNEEGKRVADLILEQKNRFHLINREIVILYRTNSQSRVFEEYLRHFNIAYRVFGGMSFYHRKEVKDLLAYLRVVINPNDEEALKRIINYPKRGIGDTTVDKIIALASAEQIPTWEAIRNVEVPQRTKNLLQEFLNMMEIFQQKSQTINAYEVATMVARQSGLLNELKSDTSIEGQGRLENFNSLLDSIKEYVENDAADVDEERNISNYLQTVSLYTDADEEKNETDYVSLMSVHAAKGLEFKSVFVVGMEEKLFPSFMSMNSPQELDEERRLFYVAITRAKQLLTITFSNSRYKFGQLVYNDPSRFISEINESHVESNISSMKTKGVEVESDSFGSSKSGIKGNFKIVKPIVLPKIDISKFSPSSPEKIGAGMKVLHLKFGEGVVKNIEGASDNRIATIHFSELSEENEKKIMLKFSKLQIVE